MSVAYYKVYQEVLNLLGAVVGSTAAAAETAYTTSPPTSSTIVGPDFTVTEVQDAVVNTLAEIVEAICSTPLHPERVTFAGVTASLANEAQIPHTNAGGTKIIGTYGYVADATNGNPLLPVDADKVRSFNEFASTVYNGFTCYWYAINGNRILHTRTNVVIEVCAFERPTVFSGNIPIDDWHERGLVNGAVAQLANKEGMFTALHASSFAAYQAHLAEIRSYGTQDNYGLRQSAPSTA